MRTWLIFLVLVIAQGARPASPKVVFTGPARAFLAISPDGRLVAAGTRHMRRCTEDRSGTCFPALLVLYSTADAKPMFELFGPDRDLYRRARFHADGTLSAQTYNAAVVWNPRTGEATWDTRPGAGVGNEPDQPLRVSSPDGTIEAALRIVERPPRDGDPRDPNVYAPDTQVWLEVSGGAGESPRRWLLAFPEPDTKRFSMKLEPYWSRARFRYRFAHAMAISPDRRWMAIGYGVRFGDARGDGQARVAFFSLADGHYAGHVDLARDQRDLLAEALSFGEMGATKFAPLGDTMAFSDDSTRLYGTSGTLFGVDVTMLR